MAAGPARGWQGQALRPATPRPNRPANGLPPLADPFQLDRFVDAQSGGVFERALAELEAGHKESHWMWFIFPQHRDLGRSDRARYYGLSGIAEASAYAAHPLLGARLRQCCRALLPHLRNRPAAAILGEVDALKLASSMQIFANAVRGEPLFAETLAAIR